MREMHYSTLSLRHGYSHLDGNGRGKVPQPNNNETIDYWMRTPLNLTHLYYDKLPVSPAYAEEDHSGYEYLLRPRKPLCIMIYAIRNPLQFASASASASAYIWIY
jgi:hypothetical protein